MSSKFLEALDARLAVLKPIAEAEVMARGAAARMTNLPDPEPGKTMDDLALTRFPAGTSKADAQELEQAFGIPADKAPYSIMVSDVDKGKPLRKIDPRSIKVMLPWTPFEIITALRPMVVKHAKAWASSGKGFGNRARAGATWDDEGFMENAQNVMLRLMRTIQSGEDRGDPYLPWVKMHVRSAASTGVGAPKWMPAARGFLGDLIKASKPDQVMALVSKIPEQDRQTDKPRQASEGNPYDEYAPRLYELAMKLIDSFKAEAAAAEEAKSMAPADSKAHINAAKEETKGLKSDIESEQGELQSYGRTLGPLTGQYDAISVTHSDAEASRYLTKILKAKDAPQVAAIIANNKPPSKASGELAKQYLAAMEAGDRDAIYDASKAIEKFLDDQGDRNAFRRKHKQVTDQTKNPKTGEMEPRQDLGKVSDSHTREEENREAVNKILMTGLKGVNINGEEVKISVPELRVFIRALGLKNYPGRGKGDLDVEFDKAKYDKWYQALSGTINATSADQAVDVPVLTSAEAQFVADISAKRLSTVDGEVDYDAYEDNLEDVMDVYRGEKVVPTVVSTEEDADEIANLLAHSTWVRKGCPPQENEQIWKDVLPNQKHHSKVGQVLSSIFGTRKKVSLKDDEKDAKRNHPAKTVYEMDPDSKIAKIARLLKQELGFGTMEEAVDLVTGSVFRKAYLIAESMRRMLSESASAVDAALLASAQESLLRHWTRFQLIGL